MPRLANSSRRAVGETNVRYVGSGSALPPTVHLQGPPPVRAWRIALAERDLTSQQETIDRLRFLGMDVRAVSTGQALLALVDSGWPDLVMLDVVLPDRSGLIVCGQIRARYDLPLVFYSASRRRDDSILGRMLGADDFIPKEIDAAEFQARLTTVLRRTAGPAAEVDEGPQVPRVLIVGDLIVDQTRRRVSLGGQFLHLTPIEYRLLVALASRPGEPVSRDELAQALWKQDYAQQDHLATERLAHSRAVDMHMVNLRVKLRAGSGPAPRIIAVRGAGYQLVPPDRAPPELA